MCDKQCCITLQCDMARSHVIWPEPSIGFLPSNIPISLHRSGTDIIIINIASCEEIEKDNMVNRSGTSRV